MYGFNSGFGTTVYQGDNRFSLRDIEFYQHKIQLSKPGKWFLRAYRTSEDAGNSYDPYATALRLQEETRSDYSYSKVYYRYWVDSICADDRRHMAAGHFGHFWIISHVHHSPGQHFCLVLQTTRPTSRTGTTWFRTGPTMAMLA